LFNVRGVLAILFDEKSVCDKIMSFLDRGKTLSVALRAVRRPATRARTDLRHLQRFIDDFLVTDPFRVTLWGIYVDGHWLDVAEDTF
jgi:hypothetical protein